MGFNSGPKFGGVGGERPRSHQEAAPSNAAELERTLDGLRRKLGPEDPVDGQIDLDENARRGLRDALEAVNPHSLEPAE